MSLMPLTKEFASAARVDTTAFISAPPPSSMQNGKTSDEAKRIAEYNLDQAEDLTGHRIDTLLRPDKLTSSGAAAQKDRQRQYQHIATIAGTTALRTGTLAIGRLSFDLSDMRAPESVRELTKGRDLAQQRHIDAGMSVSIDPKDIAYDPLTGMPVVSQARKAWLNNQGRACDGKFTAEDLVGGTYAHIDSAGGYYNKHQMDASQSALDLQQTHDKLLAQIADGTIDYESLEPQEQLIILQAQPLDKRMERYAEQNLSAHEIEQLERDVHDFQQANRNDLIGDLARSQPIVTVNGGAIIPGAYSMGGLNHAFTGAAANLAPIDAQFPAPVALSTSASFSIQPQQPVIAPGM